MEEHEALETALHDASEGVPFDESVNVPVPTASSATDTYRILREHPHACLTLSEAATWGSTEESVFTETEVPASDDQNTDISDSEISLDDDWAVHNNSSFPDNEEEQYQSNWKPLHLLR
jgi:hypothetical protein